MRAAKRDMTEREIVETVRAVGGTVVQISGVPGCPDLLIGFRGQNFLIECKSPGGRLNARQRAFWSVWRGQAEVCWTPDEVLRAIGAI